jgi:hypothetical protein
MKLGQHNHQPKAFEPKVSSQTFLSTGVLAALLAVGCSPSDRQLVGAFLHGTHHSGGSGEPSSPPAECGFSDSDQVLQLAASDVRTIDADDQAFVRYFSLVNRANVLGCGSALNPERTALSKLVNSLSLDTVVRQPLAIDVNETLYRIDLRDYAWDRPIAVAGEQFSDAWEAMVAANPYALELDGDDADDLKSDTGTAVPVVFSNSFAASAPVGALYYALLDVPESIDAFISNDLAIDLTQNLRDQKMLRAGRIAGGRGVLSERDDIQVRAGSLWQISDFGSASDLLEDPLGSPAGNRELVFSLPNGLNGYALATANGARLDDSGVAIENIRRHARGVDAEDDVRDAVLANASNFSSAERDAILSIYPGAEVLTQIVENDRSTYAASLRSLGLDINAPEPVSASVDAFEADLDLAAVAADLLVTPQQLESNLAFLDPAFGVLRGGTLAREDFNRLYLGARCAFGLVLENAPANCQ